MDLKSDARYDVLKAKIWFLFLLCVKKFDTKLWNSNIDVNIYKKGSLIIDDCLKGMNFG